MKQRRDGGIVEQRRNFIDDPAYLAGLTTPQRKIYDSAGNCYP
jgi:hypothetical protein